MQLSGLEQSAAIKSGSEVAAIAVTNYAVIPGFVGIDLNNETNGAWTNDQIYVTVIGQNPASGTFACLRPDGTIVDFSLNSTSFIASMHLDRSRNLPLSRYKSGATLLHPVLTRTSQRNERPRSCAGPAGNRNTVIP